MTTGTPDWEAVFSEIATLLRAKFDAEHPFADERDVSPDTVALRDAFYAFPHPVDVLIVSTEGVDSPMNESPIFTLIEYDMLSPATLKVRHHGTRRAMDVEKWADLLAQIFDLRGELALEKIRELSLRRAFDDEFTRFLQFVPFDIRSHLQKYSSELYEELLREFARALIGRYTKRLDFNKIYALQPDPVIPATELVRVSPVTASAVRLPLGRPATLEERQEEISDCVLIPAVPESVARTFNSAKRLYVFAYFYNAFGTVSQHYAYLALDAAVHARWSAMLKQPVTLQYRTHIETIPGSHWRIEAECRRRHWSAWETRVNGRRFANRVRFVLDDLAEQGVIGNWQRQQIESAYYWRNTLSHLEFATLIGDSPGTLRSVAEMINGLFHAPAVGAGTI